jgi:hypothetical protein
MFQPANHPNVEGYCNMTDWPALVLEIKSHGQSLEQGAQALESLYWERDRKRYGTFPNITCDPIGFDS